MTAAIDITKEQRKTLIALLRQFIPGVAVWAYGSRVKWTARPNSDLDLVAFTTPAQSPLVSELKEALAESDLPFLVDFHVWDEVPERFHEIIRKEYIVLQEAQQPVSGSGIAGDWRQTTIGEHVELATGEAFQSSRFGTTPDAGTLLARGDNIKEGEFEWGEKARYWPDLTPDLEKYLLRKDDVLLGMDGSKVGKNWVRVQEKDLPCLLVQRVARLRAKKTMDQRFLRYLIGNPQFRNYVERVRTGTSIPHISGGQIRSYEILLPPLPEQKSIAIILGSLDDKIELNRRMNATLEAMARALFQSWFVDFDPVRAKLDGRKPAGLDAATAALFPAHFQDSPLGHIPQGWRVMKFGDFIDRLPVGQKYDQKSVSPVGVVPVFDQGKSGVIGFHNNEPGVKATLDEPVVVFANHTCYMRLITYSFSAIQNVLPFVGAGVDTFWAYYATKGRLSFSEYKGHWPDFVIQETVGPSRELTDAFGRVVKPLVARIQSNEEESSTLATLRDTLLPKLLSGELCVAAV